MRSEDVLVVILLGALGSVLVRGADNATSRSESEEELPEPPMAGEKEDGVSIFCLVRIVILFRNSVGSHQNVNL